MDVVDALEQIRTEAFQLSRKHGYGGYDLVNMFNLINEAKKAAIEYQQNVNLTACNHRTVLTEDCVITINRLPTPSSGGVGIMFQYILMFEEENYLDNKSLCKFLHKHVPTFHIEQEYCTHVECNNLYAHAPEVIRIDSRKVIINQLVTQNK